MRAVAVSSLAVRKKLFNLSLKIQRSALIWQHREMSMFCMCEIFGCERPVVIKRLKECLIHDPTVQFTSCNSTGHGELTIN